MLRDIENHPQWSTFIHAVHELFVACFFGGQKERNTPKQRRGVAEKDTPFAQFVIGPFVGAPDSCIAQVEPW